MDFRCLSLQGLLGRPTWEQLVEKTRPSRPIRCDVWIVERMRYPTDRPTDRPTDQRTQPVIEVLCRT